MEQTEVLSRMVPWPTWWDAEMPRWTMTPLENFLPPLDTWHGKEQRGVIPWMVLLCQRNDVMRCWDGPKLSLKRAITTLENPEPWTLLDRCHLPGLFFPHSACQPSPAFSTNPCTVLWRSLSFLQLHLVPHPGFFPHVCGSHFFFFCHFFGPVS